MNWKDGLRRIPAPEPSKDLLERILASRAAGVRVVLPGERSAVFRRVALLLTAAAAAAVLVMATRGGDGRPVHAENGYQDIAAGISFWPPEAGAQEAGPPRRPRYEPVKDLRVARAQPGTWTYRTCTVFDDVLTNCRGRLTITITEAKWEGQPAWLTSQQQKSVRHGSSDTTDTFRTPLDTAYFKPTTLRPIYAALGGVKFRLLRRFSRDSVREEFDMGGARPHSWRTKASIPGAPDAPLVLRWARVDLTLLLQVLPLDRGWTGSVYSVGLVGPDLNKTGFIPIDLRVVGSGRIEVPAGRFECWNVELRESPESVLTLWVSKDRGWLVKTEQQGPDWRTENVLVSATPPAP
jgi:hypothetical protein